MNLVARRILNCTVAAGVTALLGVADLRASSFNVFQHGGRATGQAGAFTARAADASAVTYNPAALVRLDGFQAQAGLDFSAPVDEYRDGSGKYNARHVITFPPAVYANWTSERSPLAFGLGIDAPVSYRNDWPVLFPGRLLTDSFELQLYELHAVVAWAPGDNWSLGGGVRYLYGQLEQTSNAVVATVTPNGPLVEGIRKQTGDVTGFAGVFALHYTTDIWGWGAVLRSRAKVEGNQRASTELRDPAPAGVSVQPGLQRLAALPVDDTFEIADELRGGFWVAPYPELRIELDAAFQAWSQVDNSHAFFTRGDTANPPIVRDRDWQDTLSLRLGLEGDITDAWIISAGIALEPSPVPGDTLEPGISRGDAWVYALGASYDFPHISFDLGYSLHDYQSRGATGQVLVVPARPGSYSARDQVFAVSARWRY